MKFYQHATGRAQQGYGFFIESEGIHFNNDSFKKGRDLSRMPEGSAVYEMHYIDGQHTSLVMTQVSSYGSGNFCHTHSLISEQCPSSGSLVRLLKADNFIHLREFMGLEDFKRTNAYLPMKELDIPDYIDPAFDFDQEMISKADMLYNFLGYMWRLCWTRSIGEEITPAYIVLPRDWSLQKTIAFYSSCILYRLPENLRQYASVVFNATFECLGEFPKTTTCFVLQESPRNADSVFDFSTLDKRPPEVVNIIYHELGKGLCESVPWPLTTAFRKGLAGTGKSSRENFALAFRFQHLDILAEQSNRNMEKYQKYFCKRYSELCALLKRLPSESTKKPLTPLEIRIALLPTERAALKYWQDVAPHQDTPVNLYLDLVTKALQTPDQDMWEEYLTALGGTFFLESGQNKNDILLTYCTQHLNAVDTAGNSAEQTVITRFGALLALHLNKSADVAFAQKLLWTLSTSLLSVPVLHETIHSILCSHLNDLRQSDVTAILNAPLWTSAEKARMVSELVEALEKSSSTGEALITLCDLLVKFQFEGGVIALIQCAQRFHMNGQEAERLASTLLSYAKQNKLTASETEAILNLYADQPNEPAMRLLISQVFHFAVDVQPYPFWADLRSKMISEVFQQELSNVENVNHLLQVAETWMNHSEKQYQEVWSSFGQNIPESNQAVCNTCKRLEKNLTLKDYFLAAQDARHDWFGLTVTQELSQHFKDHLDSIIADNRNFSDMPLLLKLTSEYPKFNMGDDNRIQCIKLLDKVSLANTKPFDLLETLEEHNASFIIAYLRYWARQQESPSLDWSIVLQLIIHWGNYRDGWDAFFKQQHWTPSIKSSPWKDDLYPMHALKYVCRLLVTTNTSTRRREELLRFITTAHAWAGYVRHMEKKREFQAFIRDDRAECPSLRKWLDLN